jgi:hypothetical protein
MADDLEARRQCAAYARHIAWLRHTQPDMTDEDMDAQALAKVDEAVFGFDAKGDRNGNFIQQGVGSPGHETSNHFASIRKYEGEESWRRAIAEIYRRDPVRAKALGLSQPART